LHINNRRGNRLLQRLPVVESGCATIIVSSTVAATGCGSAVTLRKQSITLKRRNAMGAHRARTCGALGIEPVNKRKYDAYFLGKIWVPCRIGLERLFNLHIAVISGASPIFCIRSVRGFLTTYFYKGTEGL
jgi:hypothetical protein